MKQHLALITLLVDDYDKAIQFYTKKLHFELVEDTVMSPEKRWVVISPPGDEKSTSILLAKASNEVQQSHIGNQSGGRVFLFLHTDNIERDLQNLITNNIEIVREKKVEPWGTVLVFKDLYGNLWDLIEPVKDLSEKEQHIF